jgi:hypothetical protein
MCIILHFSLHFRVLDGLILVFVITVEYLSLTYNCDMFNVSISFSLTFSSCNQIYQYVTDVCHLVYFVLFCMFCNFLTLDLLGMLLHVMG